MFRGAIESEGKLKGYLAYGYIALIEKLGARPGYNNWG